MKKIVQMAMVLTTIGLLGACGNAKASNNNEKGSSNQLTFMVSADTNAKKKAFEWMAEEYEKQSGTKIKLEILSGSDIETKLKSALLSNKQPDLARVSSVSTNYTGYALDLTDIYNKYDFYNGTKYTYDDAIIGISAGVSVTGFYVNKTLWDEAGVSYPKTPEEVWTWQEFTEKANEVVEKTDADYAMAMKSSENNVKCLAYSYNGKSRFSEDGKTANFASADFQDAYQFFVDLNDDKFMPKSVMLSGEDPASLFKTGRVASLFSGSGQLIDFEQTIENFEYAAVYTPKGETRATMQGGDYVVGFKNTGNETETKKFIDWMYHNEVQSAFCSLYGSLPAIEGVSVDYGKLADHMKVFQNELDETSPMPAQDLSLFQDLTEPRDSDADIEFDNLKRAINGDVTVEEAREQMQSELASTTDYKVEK